MSQVAPSGPRAAIAAAVPALTATPAPDGSPHRMAAYPSLRIERVSPGHCLDSVTSQNSRSSGQSTPASRNAADATSARAAPASARAASTASKTARTASAASATP
jgi:hypothetical protein